MTGQATSARRPWSIVLASREVWPFVEGGGIGRYMWAAARFLASDAHVTVLTSSRWKARYEEVVAARDERLPDGVRFAFVDEPDGDLSPFLSWNHAWSVRLLDAAADLHPDGGPDILELGDYQAEGFAPTHARRGHDPRLRNTTLVVRLHTSAEMCAAMNEDPGGVHLDLIAGLERFSLRFADAVLEPGGNCVEHYRDFYGEDALAPTLESPLPITADVSAPEVGPPPGAGPVRLLYLSRLEARKGIVELVSAVRSLPDAELELTVVGGDTQSGPGGTSMRAHVEELAGGDARIRFADQVPHDQVARLIGEHHAVVVPTRWETFSYVVREALACNRPVVATPSGAIVDVVRAGESGWLAEAATTEAIAAVLREVADSRDELIRMIEEERPRRALDRDSPGDRTLAAYHELLERRDAAAGAGNGRPAGVRITALVECQPGGGDPLPTMASLEAQRGVSVSRVLVAPAGSFPGAGAALARAGAIATTASEALDLTSDALVLLLPAGATLDQDFARRAATVLAYEQEVAWVSAFARTGDTPNNAPPGNYELPLAELRASPSAALIRRTALEAALNADGDDLFVRLADAGAYGVVLQERLFTNLPRRAARRALTQS